MIKIFSLHDTGACKPATKRSLFSRIFLCETNLNVGDRRLSVYCEAHQPSLPGHFTLELIKKGQELK